MSVEQGCRLPGDRKSERSALWAAASILPLGERLHLSIRFRSAPWERLLPAFEPGGDLLDVGCGPGLLLHLLRRSGFRGTYLGIDVDARKIGRARRWLAEGAGARFEVLSVGEATASSFDQVAVVDVLYLLPPDRRGAFVAEAVAGLRPGGRIVALTSGGGAGWKRRLDTLQERLAVWLHVTEGAAVAPCDGAEIAALLEGAGLAAPVVTSVGAGYAHGFEMVTARRPETG